MAGDGTHAQHEHGGRRRHVNLGPASNTHGLLRAGMALPPDGQREQCECEPQLSLRPIAPCDQEIRIGTACFDECSGGYVVLKEPKGDSSCPHDGNECRTCTQEGR